MPVGSTIKKSVNMTSFINCLDFRTELLDKSGFDTQVLRDKTE